MTVNIERDGVANDIAWRAAARKPGAICVVAHRERREKKRLVVDDEINI
jgi:hypothetical protein